MDKNELEYQRSRGKVPDKFYYQMSGGTAQENYNEQRRIILKGYKAKKDESIFFLMLKEMLEGTLKDLLNGLKLD